MIVRVTTTIGKYAVRVPRALVNLRVTRGGGSMFAGSSRRSATGLQCLFIPAGLGTFSIAQFTVTGPFILPDTPLWGVGGSVSGNGTISVSGSFTGPSSLQQRWW
jgi:hypothetical protein